MYNLLMEKLRSYIQQNNPEILLVLNAQYHLTIYLEDKVSKVIPTVTALLGEGKPGYVIEELAMNELTADLRPSRFNYIKKIIKEDFPKEYQSFSQLGVLTYEAVNLIPCCKEIFEAFSFTEENENSQLLRHAIIAKIQGHLI